MREYLIELFGVEYLVISTREGTLPKDHKPFCGKCAHIFPDEADGFVLESCGGCKACTEELFAIATAHFSAVRRFPSSTLGVRAGDTTKEIEIFNTDTDILPLPFLKCKLLSAKTVFLSDLTEHLVYTVDCGGGRFRILRADVVGGFDRAVLPRLLVLDGLPPAEGSAVLFPSGEVVSYPMHRRLSCLSAAALVFGDSVIELDSGAVMLFRRNLPLASVSFSPV